jgi:hypothetical protein
MFTAIRTVSPGETRAVTHPDVLSLSGLLVRSTATALALLLLMAPGVHAYIDPITGSILLQVIGAGILAFVLTAKRVWRKLGRGVRRMVELLPARPPPPGE